MLCSVIKSFSLEEELNASTETVSVSSCSVFLKFIHFIPKHQFSIMPVEEIIYSYIMLLQTINATVNNVGSTNDFLCTNKFLIGITISFNF